MNFDEVMHIVGRWGGTLKFFPSDPDARIGITEEVASMCSDIEQVRWLIKRVPQLHREWPGIFEVRAALCSKFQPKDGIDVGSAVYLDGIPSEKESHLALAAPPSDQKRLEGPVSASPSLDATVRDLAAATNMNSELRRRRPTVREVQEVRLTGENRITAEDVEREVERLRQKRAEEELKLPEDEDEEVKK